MIAVIIVEYKTPERTVKYVEDFLEASDVKDCFFVIVDNSPDMFNGERIRELLVSQGYEFSIADKLVGLNGKLGCFSRERVKIYYYTDYQNCGFARANNIGASIAKQLESAELYLFSNSDIQFRDKLKLSRLVEIINSDERNALVGPRVTGLDGKTQSPCRYMNIWKRHIIPNVLWPVNKGIKPLKSMSYDTIENASSGETYRVIGAFMLAKATLFHGVEGFDNKTFLYAEESILSERYRNKGYKVLYEDSVEIIHEQGGSTTEKSKSYGQNIIAKRDRLFNSEIYYYEEYIGCNKALIDIAKASFAFYRWKLKLYYHI